MSHQTPWEILNVTPESSLAEIKKAYAKLAKENNPEEHPDEFRKLNDAYKSCSSIAKLRAKGQTVVVVQKDGTKTVLASIEKDKENEPDASSVESSEEKTPDFDFNVTEDIPQEPRAPKRDLGEDFDNDSVEYDNANAFDFSEINSEEASNDGLDPLDFFNKTCYETHMAHPNKPFSDEEIVRIAIKYLCYINTDSNFSHNKMIWEQFKHNRLVVDAFTLPIFEEEVNKIGLRYNDAKSLCMCIGGKSKPVFDNKTNSYKVDLDFTSQYYIDTYMSRVHRNVKPATEETSSEKTNSDESTSEDANDLKKKEIIEENEAKTESDTKTDTSSDPMLPEAYFEKLINERNLQDFDPKTPQADFDYAAKSALLIDTVIDYFAYIAGNDTYKNEIFYYNRFLDNELVKHVRKYDAFLGKINQRRFDQETLKILAEALGKDYEAGTFPNTPNQFYVYRKAPNQTEPDYKKLSDPLALHKEYLRQIELAKNKAEGSLSNDVKFQLIMHYLFILNRDEIYKRQIAWDTFTNDPLVREVFTFKRFRNEIVKVPLKGDFALLLAKFYHKNCDIKFSDKTKECFIVIPDKVKAPTLNVKKESKLPPRTQLLLLLTLLTIMILIAYLLAR
ncbi:MAG: J domain-containing protein [Clostridia bacterium]|nr:J domain-containing protein [Clostridia bacterium]